MSHFSNFFWRRLKCLTFLFIFIIILLNSALAEITPKEYMGATFKANKQRGYFYYKLAQRDGGTGYDIKFSRKFYPYIDRPDSTEINVLSVGVGRDLALKSLELNVAENKNRIDITADKVDGTITVKIKRNDYETGFVINGESQVYPSLVLPDLVADNDLAVGSYEYLVFHEAILELSTIKLEVARKFKEQVGGEEKQFFEIKISNDKYYELDQKIIFDDTGRVVNRHYVNM